MLLRKWITKEPKKSIGIGQITLWIGAVFVLAGCYINDQINSASAVSIPVCNIPISDLLFFSFIITGIVLIGISVVFNITGIMQMRMARKS